MRKTIFARKFVKKSLPGAPFGAKDRFLVDFGDPQGTQKSSQRGYHHWGKGSWELSGSHFGRFSAFFSILPPFLVNSGSILGHPGSNFINFGSFFVVCVCVCVSFVWGGTLFFWVVGLLCCWVLGFLSCWVALFLGCWVVGWFGCLLVVGLLGCWVLGFLDS